MPTITVQQQAYMRPYLSATEIWVEPTPVVLSLASKLVLVVGQSKRRVSLAVTPSNPGSPNAGNVAVAARPTPDGRSWASPSLLSQSGIIDDSKWYLGEDAFPLLCATGLARTFGCELQLSIPSTAE